ncbi:hypothetical protein GCM10027443_38060 [Pontibacter brevis]
MYFDEVNGRQNQKEANVKVFVFEKNTDQFVKEFTLSLREIRLLTYSNVGCTTSNLKTSRLLYYEDLNLAPTKYNHPDGYYVVMERCCRNNAANNISSLFEAGTAIYMEFPPVFAKGKAFVNSSPKLTPPPSEYACQGELFYYNFGSTDADGDQLVYDMVSPLNGYSTAKNFRPGASSAPYPEVSWLPGYNKDNQIKGNPALNVDSNTGWLTVRPSFVGLFVFGVRVQEFRNGVKIGEVRRDFQLLVKACRFNGDPIVSIVQIGSPNPSANEQELYMGPTDSRCLKILYTDPDINEPLTLEVKPVNYTNSNVFSMSGATSGVANIPNGNTTLEATLCLDQCFSTNGQPLVLDLIVSDDGDDGCSLPKQTVRRISLNVETGHGNAPDIALSTPVKVFEVSLGDRIDFDVTGTDADEEQVSLSASGRGFQLGSQNITFQPGSNRGRASSPFTWTIDREALKQPSYLIDFLVTSVTACGNTLTRTETIEVRPLQLDDFANNVISADQTLCAGQAPATLMGSLPTGGSGDYAYTWEMSTRSAETGFALAPGPGNKEQHYTPPALTGPAWFRRKANSGLDDELVSNVVQVTMQDAIGNNTISRAQAICASTAPSLLTGTEPTGGSGTYAFQWEYSTTSSTSGFKPISVPGKGKAKDYQPGPLIQTTWYRRVVVSAPCPPVFSNAVEITVTPDVSQNTIKGDQVVCEGSAPGKLTGPVLTSNNDSFTYEWQYSTTSATAGFSSAPSLNTAPDYTPGQVDQPTWFRRIVRTAAASCQSTSNTVQITLEALPATPTATNVVICPGETATLQVSAPATGMLYRWYDKPDGGKLLREGTTYQTNPLHTTTDFYVQAVSRNGCASTSRTKVTATLRPSTANAGEDVTIMEGQSVKLQATGGTSYSWSPANGLYHLSISDPTVRPERTTSYTVTVTSEFGCAYTAEVTVTVLPHIVPTNAITVNGDNINETWFIKNIELYPNCHVQIFTRWGNKIFDSKGYREPWNGTHNGMPLPMAAYYYIIDLGMNEKPVSGSITLIK